MKQHITTKQLNELSEKGENYLIKWWKKSQGDADIVLLSIGQLIEFLGNSIEEEFIYAQWDTNNNCESWVVNADGESYRSKNLVDALWEAVKEVLNGDKEKEM